MPTPPDFTPLPLSRRELLQRVGMGMGTLGLAGLAQIMAVGDGLSTVSDATLLNLHLWIAAGFGAIHMRKL